MHRLFLLCCLLAIGLRPAAQREMSAIPPHSSLAYFRFGGGAAVAYTSGYTGSVGLVVIPKRYSWGGAFEHRAVGFEAKNLPSDYKPGTSFWGGPNIPHDEMAIWSLHAIRAHFFPTSVLRAR